MGGVLGGSLVGLMVTSSKRSYATCYETQVCCTQPLPLQQATADPFLCRRHSNTLRQVWLSLSGVPRSWCTQGFVWAFWASLVGMGFDSKHDFTPPTILLGLLLSDWMWGIFFLVGSNILLSLIVQHWIAILELQKKMSTYPSTLPSCYQQTGKGQFSFQSQRKAMWKYVQTTAQLPSSHTRAK